MNFLGLFGEITWFEQQCFFRLSHAAIAAVEEISLDTSLVPEGLNFGLQSLLGQLDVPRYLYSEFWNLES
jgi:hypothetical protein